LKREIVELEPRDPNQENPSSVFPQRTPQVTLLFNYENSTYIVYVVSSYIEMEDLPQRFFFTSFSSMYTKKNIKKIKKNVEESKIIHTNINSVHVYLW
jgi:hypothetical protein